MTNNVISQEEMLNAYKKFSNEYLGENPHSVTLTTFSEFYKGIECTKCIGTRYSTPAANFRDEIIDNQGRVAIFSNEKMRIADREKSISISYLMMGHTYPADKRVTIGDAHMIQVTPDGVYEFQSDAEGLNSSNYFRFYSNNGLMRIASEHNRTLEEQQNRLVLGYSDYSVLEFAQELPMPKINVSREDFAMLCNKIYREGLPHIAQIAMRGGTLEITDEDRKFYEPIIGKQDMKQTTQISSLNGEKLTTNNENKIQELKLMKQQIDELVNIEDKAHVDNYGQDGKSRK